MDKEKKEIGMEKLIQLLNEHLQKFDTEIHRTPKVYAFEEATKSFIAENGISYRQERVISKRFEFIKWLVNEDKIDFSREGNLSNELVDLFERKLDTAEGVIALLSIQDNPIEFLLSILKQGINL